MQIEESTPINNIHKLPSTSGRDEKTEMNVQSYSDLLKNVNTPSSSNEDQQVQVRYEPPSQNHIIENNQHQHYIPNFEQTTPIYNHQSNNNNYPVQHMNDSAHQQHHQQQQHQQQHQQQQQPVRGQDDLLFKETTDFQNEMLMLLITYVIIHTPSTQSWMKQKIPNMFNTDNGQTSFVGILINALTLLIVWNVSKRVVLKYIKEFI